MTSIIAAAHNRREKAEQEAEDREQRKQDRKAEAEAEAGASTKAKNDVEDSSPAHTQQEKDRKNLVDEELERQRVEKEKQKFKLEQRKTKALEELVPEPMLPGQKAVLKLYHGNVVQIGVAVLIFVNFFVSMAAAQIGPKNCKGACKDVFTFFEWFFNILFLVELLINMYAHWMKPFWKSGWNIFDFVIVIISWVSMLFKNPSVAVLRLFRAFRAFRLFKRIEAVKIIVLGVGKSLPGVSNAFMLLLIIIGIWAIMGVSFFRFDFPDFFGNFFLAVLTLFQVMTFDSWVSQITRPVCLYYNSWGAPLYFLSYILIAGIIMTNVVVAILLDQFMKASADLEAAKLQNNDEDDNPDLPKQEEEDEDPEELSKHFWGKLKKHLEIRVGNLDSICRKPMPETLTKEQRQLEDKVKREAEEQKKRRAADVLPGQSWLKEVYDSPPPQLFVAGAIVANFFVSAAKAQTVPPGDDPPAAFVVFEWIFNLIFGIELIVNMYANGRPFWKDNWNIFDFLIVVISWASMLGLLKGGISVLRLFRAFRVFRLFKRVKALRQIIAGILQSLPGVCNAFIILFLVMGIWSIMGCNFFGEKFEDEYGNFARAMLSMFQIMSYDSWSSGITRPVVTSFPNNPVPPIFFLTYVFISAIIMSNVVLAILLDKFLAASKEFNKAEAAEGTTDYVYAVDAELKSKLEHDGYLTKGQFVRCLEDDEGAKVEVEFPNKDDRTPPKAETVRQKDIQGLVPLPEIMETFEPRMKMTKEHVNQLKNQVLEELDKLDKFVQGDLKNFMESQKDLTLGLEGNRPSFLEKGGKNFLSMFGIGGSSKKTSRVAPS